MYIAHLLDHWKEVRRDLFRALDKITDEQLNFVPREGLWSLGQVARHIAQAEEFWFRFIVRRELAEQPRFSAEAYPTVKSVKALLTEVHDRTEAYLVTLSEADLGHTFATPWGEEPSLRWIIWHVFEHEIHHRGEIFLMLGLMGMEGPDI
jgi:uncharacterized damage-inducible protein DinB